ncbi:MAG: response regulator [Bacteroidota bacterium]
MDDRKVKILAIDDNPDNLVTLKAVVNEVFPEILVYTASNGRKGLELATVESPDVILLDIVMPEMDGFEVCRKLKSDPMLCDIPVIFVTALQGDKQSRIEALEAGGEAFLAKPIDPSELTAQIRAMVKIKQANSEKHAEKERLAALVAEKTRELKETNLATLNLLEDLRKEYEARAKSEEDLRKSEEKYRLIFENVQDVFYQTDLSGIILEISPSIKYFSDFSRDELIGASVEKIYADPDDRAALLNMLSQSGELRDYEVKLKTRDGEIRNVSINARLLFDKQGWPHHIDGAIRDITERKKAEKQIGLLSRAVEQSPVTVVITDINGNIEYTNPKFTEVTGYASEELAGKNLRLLQSGDQPREFYKDLWETILSGKDWNGVFHNKKKNGELYWESAAISSLVGSDGRISHFIGIKEDITEKRKLTTDLVLAKEKAEESDRLKSAFLANMSHEIRTPMNGILGFAGLLKEPGLSGDEQQKYIRIIEKSGARMLNIINDIVCISKIEAGQMEVHLSETNINEQMEFLYTFFKPEAEQKGIAVFLQRSLPSKEAMIVTDREKLYAILCNLLKNAIKFSDSGILRFGCSHGQEGSPPVLDFFVSDEGIGIPKERQQAIFDRFVQADIGDKRAFQGAGLGLSISKAFVEMLGGEITVQSEVGIGSEFHFTIPYQRPQEQSESVSKSIPVVPTDENTRKLKILIAEDDEHSEMFLELAIKVFGNDILRAKTGAEAIEICRGNPGLDLILMDLKMPVMDGYEATRRIREFNSRVIIIAQTAYGLTGDCEKALAAGCNDYLPKPVKKDELLACISKFFHT